MESQGLSVVIIAKNAEKTIARCLQSVVNLAKEVIVVTNNCTDNTSEIAITYGATVIDHKWEGFCNQKNFAIELAKYEWILSIDADEEVSKELSSSIKSFISKGDQRYVGARVSRKTMFINKWITHGDWYPDKKLRIVRNGHGKFVGGSVHERLEVEGDITSLRGDLLHYSGESVYDFVKRNIEYSNLSARDKINHKKFEPFAMAVLHSFWKFFRCYIIKLGFLDGPEGFFIAKTQSYLSLYKYFLAQNFYKNQEKQ